MIDVHFDIKYANGPWPSFEFLWWIRWEGNSSSEPISHLHRLQWEEASMSKLRPSVRPLAMKYREIAVCLVLSGPLTLLIYHHHH